MKGNIIQGKGNLHIPVNSRLKQVREQDINTLYRPAVFLDRDGVLIEDVGYLNDLSKTRILDGVSEGLRSIKPYFYIIVVTNQSAIGRGIISGSDLFKVHDDLCLELFKLDQGVVIDAMYYCPHVPVVANAESGFDCCCRKPKPGMLYQAESDWNLNLSESFMIGDRLSDMEAGRSAGLRNILLSDSSMPALTNIHRSPNLVEAAKIISGPVIEEFHMPMDITE